jgi:tetratricopeptide (TPR) repeat protein
MREIYKKPVWGELLLPMFIIIAVSLAVYSNILGNGFAYDDNYQLLGNPWIKDAKFIPEIFSNNVWGFRGEITNYYRPMMYVIYLLTYYLFGIAPWGFHLVSVVLHAGSSVLVFMIARILFSEYKSHSKYLSISLMAAALFAVHPIHTEAVDWVSCVPELSYSFFCMLSLYLYLRSENRFNTSYYLSVVAFFVGTLCKEPAITLPGLLIACDLLLNKKKPELMFILKRYALFALAASAYLCIRFYALGASIDARQHGEYSHYGNSFIIFVTYIKKLILPINLKLFYSFKPAQSLFEASAFTSILITALIVALFYVAYKKDRLVFFCLLIIVVPLLPCLYTPAITGSSVQAERYLYLPSAGFCMLVSLLVSRLAGSQGRNAAVPVLLALIALYSTGTILRNADWKDDYSLWTAELKNSPQSDVAKNNLLSAAGTHIDLGVEYEKRGHDDLAIEEYIAATNCNPPADDAYLAYKSLGNVYRRMGRVDKAIEAFEKSLIVNPNNADMHNDVGIEYVKKGDIEKAIEHFRAAVRLDPTNSMPQENLDNTLRRYKTQ